MITPLKITTEYSLLKSVIKVPSLIAFLKENNIDACGICDDELFGVMEFYLACKDNNIKPLIGLDVVIENQHLYLYAKNYEGYLKLLKINSIKDHLGYSFIEDKNVFIIIPYSNIDTYQEFKNKQNIYIAYTKLSEKQNALLVSENVIYMPTIRALNEEDALYLKYLKDLGGIFNLNEEEYYKDIKKDEDDIKRVNTFISEIDIEIPFDKRYIPVYKENIDSYKYLSTLAMEGLKKRLSSNIPNNYLKRLQMELDTVNKMGFVDYFLIVYDYVLYAKKHGCLVGPGRGSAAGSLISYAVGITDIDPIKFNLLFARFLNPSRKKMPDIDIDFDDEKREEIISYVKEKYGHDKVALGITFSTYKSKLVLRDLAKVLKIDSFVFDKFIKNINSSLSLKDNSKNEIIIKFLKLYPELNNLYNIAYHLEGLKKNISTHAAGVVISSTSLDNVIPTYMDSNTLKTGFPMEYLEKLGLLKMDFLGVRNLTLIKEIIKKIPNFSLKDIPLDDKKTYEIFKNADTDNIFQFESLYAKTSLKKLSVENFNELSIAIALVRPGPSSQIDAYIENKNKEVDPNLKEILSDTRGIIIYQEQVMQIFEYIGGFTSFEADDVRIAMSKKKEDIIQKAKERFISGGKKNGYDEKYVTDLFNKMAKFSEYGFNKSHSVAYALIAYQMAFLKANYNVEFTSVMLQNSKSINDKNKYLNDLKMKGIKLLKPNINVSGKEFEYKNKYLLLPFSIVKGFNENVQNEIILRRGKGFKDIFDFFLKCYDLLNENIYKMLVLSGCLDTFKYSKKTLIESFNVLLNYAQMNDESLAKPYINKLDEYALDELMKYENDYYGFYIGNHPCSIYNNVIKVNQLDRYMFKNIKMILLVEKVVEIKTKKGDPMAFAIASDETGEAELTLFTSIYNEYKDLKKGDIILVDVKCTKRFDKTQIIVNNIKRK